MVEVKKKRGAQPGNANAVSHGFYSRHFKEAETADLDALLSDGLQDEIAMLRVMTRRVMDLGNEVQDVGQVANLLGVLGVSATRLAGLLRTQKLLGGDGGDAARAISEALAQMTRELRIR
jgi:hypothetical protein